jgi:hypothetical protein
MHMQQSRRKTESEPSPRRGRRWVVVSVFVVVGASVGLAAHFRAEVAAPLAANVSLGRAHPATDEPANPPEFRTSVFASALASSSHDDDPAPVSVVAEREPRTEREHLRALLALDADDPSAFERRIDALLASDGTSVERFAALRAVYEHRPADAPARFAHAVAAITSRAGDDAESFPHSVVGWLERRAGREALARASLAAIVWGDEAPDAPRLRERALRAWILAAPGAEIPEIELRLAFESDPSVRQAGQGALDERQRPESSLTPIEEFP